MPIPNDDLSALDDPVVRNLLLSTLRGEGTQAARTIPQSTLLTYDTISQLKQAQRRLRDDLLSGFDAGAKIEPGPRTLRIPGSLPPDR